MIIWIVPFYFRPYLFLALSPHTLLLGDQSIHLLSKPSTIQSLSYLTSRETKKNYLLFHFFFLKHSFCIVQSITQNITQRVKKWYSTFVTEAVIIVYDMIISCNSKCFYEFIEYFRIVRSNEKFINQMTLI